MCGVLHYTQMSLLFVVLVLGRTTAANGGKLCIMQPLWRKEVCILCALLFWVYSCQKRTSFLTRCCGEWLSSLFVTHFYISDGRFSVDQFPIPSLHVPFFLCNGHSCSRHCGRLSRDHTPDSMSQPGTCPSEWTGFLAPISTRGWLA